MQTLAISTQEPYKERPLVPVSFLRVNEPGLPHFMFRHIMTSDSTLANILITTWLAN